MEILNKKIKCTFLTDIKVKDCMITLYGGSYYMLSNSKELDRSNLPPKELRRGYKYSLHLHRGENLDYVIRDWCIKNIRPLRKLNHET